MNTDNLEFQIEQLVFINREILGELKRIRTELDGIVDGSLAKNINNGLSEIENSLSSIELNTE